jgi:ribonuclease D
MDTEFMRVNTFYPQLALIQINDGDAIYLIDPLEISEWETFTELMLSPSVLKIFHSCSEDLGVFAHHFGLLPAPLFDTQIANAFLNQGFGLGERRLPAAIG